MKEVKWKNLLIGLVTLSVAFGLNSKTASALGFKSGSFLNFSGGIATFAGGNSTINGNSNGARLWFENGLPGDLKYLRINFGSTIPKNSLLNISISYRAQKSSVSAPFVQYFGFKPAIGWSLLSENCFVEEVSDSGLNTNSTFQNKTVTYCNYSFWNDRDMNYLASIDDTPIAFYSFISTTSSNPAMASVLVNAASYTQIDSNALTVDDKNYLNDLIANMPTADAQMKEVADNTEATNQALEEQNQKDQQDRSNMENQQTDTQDTADDVGSDISTGFQSLFSVIASYIVGINSPPSSDCKIDADMGHLDLGSIDVCQLSLPDGFGIIASLLLIGAVIPFAFLTIRSLIDMITEAIS